MPLSFIMSSFRVTLYTKHPEEKGAKKMRKNRPMKTRPSDINRKKPDYPSFVKPAEYSISDEPATPVLRKTE
jgi:hypothetical protein